MQFPSSPLITGKEGKTCIIITGPTAVGKTAFSIRLAQYFSTTIISCDSRQCYKELNIGVAKPSAEELALIPHHFINSHSVYDTVNAALFEEYALKAISGIFAKNNIAVMVGGTGLYIKAFCEGLDAIPVIDDSIAKNINRQYSEQGLHWLQEEVKKMDPFFFARGENKNPHRLLRALEVKLSTGHSICDFQTQDKKTRNFRIIKIALQMPKDTLLKRINERIDSMMEQGFVEEVKALLQYRHLNALQTVGYKELFSYLDKEITLQQATEAIKVNTRRYAKRQMTWFKKDNDIHWYSSGFQEILTEINKLLEAGIRKNEV